MSKRKIINTTQVTIKRKTASAHAILRVGGTGEIRINQIPIQIWRPEFCRRKIFAALSYLDPAIIQRFDINVQTHGGGFSSITDAAIISIIRTIVEHLGDLQLENTIKLYDRSVLVPDTRRGMSKTPLGKGARAREQKSYR